MNYLSGIQTIFLQISRILVEVPVTNLTTVSVAPVVVEPGTHWK